jgi:hypothetical protein
MSDLTNHLKAASEGLIRHARPTTLLPLGIATIATYTFLKAVVVDYSITLDGHRPFFKPATRYRFREDFVMPRGIQIWLAHHRQRDKLSSGRAWSSTLQLYSGIAKGFHFYIFTYMVGCLVVQLTCPQWGKSAVPRLRDLPVLDEAPGWRAYTVQIWPDVSAAHWPPPRDMNRQTLERFRHRFRDLQSPVKTVTKTSFSP